MQLMSAMTINNVFHGICNEDIWDYNLTWNTNEPNFSPCLRYTILTWIPCAFLILFSIFEILSIKSLKPKQSSWSLLNSSRLFFAVIAVLANIFEYGFHTKEFLGVHKYPYIFFISSAIKVITFLIFTVLLLFQKEKGVASLATPWIFTLIHIICFVPTISQLWLHKDKFIELEFYFNIAYFCLLLILFILCSFADSFKRREGLIEQEEIDPEREETARHHCPESTASFPSQLFFWWYTSFTYLGYKKTLVTDDIFDINEEDKHEVLVPAFEKSWYSNAHGNRIHRGYEEVRYETASGNRSVVKTIFKTFWYDITILSLLLLLDTVCTLLSPVLLQSILRFISSSDPTWHGIVIVIAMFAANIVANFSINAYYLRAVKLQMKLRCCLTNAIYKKSLRISSAAKKSSTSGEVVNLMAVDTQRLLDLTIWFLYSIFIPVIIVVSLWLMYNQLGYSAFGGLVVLVVMVPIVYFSSVAQNKYQAHQLKFKDERLKYLNETLNGIKVLKFYAWEPSFIKLITDIRSKEMNAYKKVAFVYGILMFQWTFVPFLVGFVVLLIYSFSNSSHVLTAEKIFVTLNLIEILNVPLSALPQLIAFSVMAYVSAKRINKYLNSPELQDYVTREDSDFAVEIKNGLFGWEPSELDASDMSGGGSQTNAKEGTLVDINFKVEFGSLHAIVGQVGSGKSSLLSAILGELERVNGTVNIHRKLKIAYVSQQAWIENLTVRDNILFGKEYYKEKFEQIIDACALRPDLEILPAGELTEIGEKGINLSGGQKQRVSLARACYSDADLYLFDDPLSAVDAHVAKHLFNHLFSSQKGLLKNKTRILVTNRLDILPKVDYITVLKDGKISEQGTYNDLIENDNDFADFMKQFSDVNVNTKERQTSISSSSSATVEENKEEVDIDKVQAVDKLVEEENVEIGKVKFSVYKRYMSMVSITWSVLVVAAAGCFYITQVAGNVWLSRWASDNITGDAKHDIIQRNYRFEIYGIIGFLQLITGCFGNYAFINAGLLAAVKLHRMLLERVFRSPMSFFETTPLGRIVNRFSKDIDSVDTLLPMNFKELIDRIFETIAAMGVIASQTGPFILIIFPLIGAFYFIQSLYISTSRQLQRLRSITQSPIYAHFTQTLQGVSTIRAYNEARRFIHASNKRVELNLICFFALMVSNRWLSVFLNLFGSAVVLFVGFYAVFQRDLLTAGMVGLTITYSFMITQTLIWLVRCATTVETNIVSVERINEYCENKVEAEWENESNKPPFTWPQNGIVEFDKYATRYREGLDLVLNDVSATIKSSEKIGIVGRTGAGKSTITMSLFRILEAAKGRIMIDGLNIADLGLHDLRSKLTIIPQDPVLFSGTLRFNLDPFEVYSDDQIWEALQHSHLHQFVSGLEKGLSHEITEGGENLSVGQRQLMCLARALLRRSKILILDEATAAVDLETDSLIQATIRDQFANCTTLTVAHRIQTILDCDRVMVIDKGTVVEFDSPSTLLGNQNSMFYALAKNAGLVE